MALPASGAISLSNVNTELGLTATAAIDMNTTNVRTLFGVASGAISMSNGYGKSNAPAVFSFTRTISANTQNYNLRADMLAGGYSGTGAFTANVTINSGIYVWSDTTATAGFDTGSLSGGTINLTNNGFIMGKGGAGATAIGGNAASNGFVGGNALNIQHPITIANNSYIAGGGGGGASGGTSAVAGGGGGAGGGVGGGGMGVGYTGTTAGGAVGATGATGLPTAQVVSNTVSGGAGGGGGRILPGTGGASFTVSRGTGATNMTRGGSGGGSGGGGSAFRAGPGNQALSTNSTAGGSASAVGGSGSATVVSAGGGGGWGAAGGQGYSPSALIGSGGTGGKAVNLNGNAVTWSVTGTNYGAIS